jgi:hypothetical protein
LLILLYLDLVSSMFELLPYASLKCSNNITDLIFFWLKRQVFPFCVNIFEISHCWVPRFVYRCYSSSPLETVQPYVVILYCMYTMAGELWSIISDFR